MGWSCAAYASDTLEKWTAACVKSTGSSNGWRVGEERFFVEISNREHRDGAITGTVFKMLPVGADGRTFARKVSTIRIEPNGRVSRAPKFLKDAAVAG